MDEQKPQPDFDLFKETPVGAIIPPQAKLNDPKCYVLHPGQWKLVNKYRGRATVRNVGSGQVMVLDYGKNVDHAEALGLVEGETERRRQLAKKNRDARMGYQLPEIDETHNHPREVVQDRRV